MVGHDFGGAVALRALLLEGAHYQRLALVDPVALGPWGTGLFHLVRGHTEVFTALPAVHHEALVRAHIRTAAHRPLPEENVDALVAPWLGPSGQAAHYRQIAQNDQRYTDEAEPRYGDIDLPVHIAWGEQDAWIRSPKPTTSPPASPRAACTSSPRPATSSKKTPPPRSPSNSPPFSPASTNGNFATSVLAPCHERRTSDCATPTW